MILGFITIAMLQQIAVSAGAASISGLITMLFKRAMDKKDIKKGVPNKAIPEDAKV